MSVCDERFCHFHRHSEFSPLDGTGNANQYAERAAQMGQPWLGISDHGVLGGVLDHIRACRLDEKELEGGYVDIDSELRPGEKRHKDERIVPIVGCEVFFTGGESRGDTSYSHNIKPHLCLHASGITGWHNLIRLTTEANISGWHGVPRVDFELWEQYRDGLICTTACLSSPHNRLILAGDIDGAREWLLKACDITKGNLWIELQPHDLDEQRLVNLANINLANELGLGMIAAADAHAYEKERLDTQDIVFAMSRKQNMKKRSEAQEQGDEVYGKTLDTQYLMSAQEMKQFFLDYHPDIPESVVEESINNTAVLAKSFKPYVVNRDLKTPRATNTPQEAETILREWCEEGFERERERRGQEFIDKEQEYRDRLEFELDTIRKKDVLDYFVIVADLVRWAKENGIRVGPGRGSAAGCLLSYLIGITGIDPIGYGLLFERFLNPDRKGLPDIDVDFASADRERVIRYLEDKYGAECVAHVITYSTFGPRAAISEVSKFFNDGPDKVEYLDMDKAKKPLGTLDKGLAKLRTKYKELDEFATKYKRPWKTMLDIDDMVKAPSKHASAILVTDKPVREYAPIQRSRGKRKDHSDDTFVVAWADRAAFPIISDYGLFKIDVLGLEELDKHEYSCQSAVERTGIAPDLYSMPVVWDPYAAEPEVMDAFKRGLTLGVFQFGGEGFTKLIRAIKPDTILDLVAANALYRPGAMEFSFAYAKRKKGEEEVTYWHEAVEPFLGETYGLLAYQEQIMQICKTLGGFTPGQADDMRKAISKLYRLPGDEAQKFMGRFREQWNEGCAQNGIDDAIRDQIWNSILAWGEYGFNKSHSASYALLAYIDMWIKVHYPHEFYAALLTHRGKLETQDILREARILGVNILPPDVNKSERGFTVEGDALRYGLVSIDSVGGKAAQQVDAGREDKPYESYEDFLDRSGEVDMGETMNLIKAGALDSIADRIYLLSEVKKFPQPKWKIIYECGCKSTVVDWQKSIYCRKHDGIPMKEKEEHDPSWPVAKHIHHNRSLKKPKPVPEQRIEPSSRDLANMELEVMGISLSQGSTAVKYESILADRIYTQEEFEAMDDGDYIVVGGEIRSVRTATIKNGVNKGREMAYLDITFAENTWSCTLFADQWQRWKDTINGATAVIVEGKKNIWKDSESIIVRELEDLEVFASNLKD